MSQPQKSEALAILRKALEKIPDLRQLGRGKPEFEKWRRNTEIAIAEIFGENSQNVRDFIKIHYSPIIMFSNTTDAMFQKAYHNGLDSASSVLQSMIKEVEKYWDEDAILKPEKLEKAEKPNKPEKSVDFPAVLHELRKADEIFIIHGQDKSVMENVAEFITKLGLEPIILHDQSGQGRTIIEELEQHTRIGFALVILTPDETCSLNEAGSEGKLHARQDVIFEFGYFLGRLGRQRVCALAGENVEVPSDYPGVLYIPLDTAEAWKIRILKVLKTAGYKVDANLVI
jgi:predicted nucleotide-binding protein